MCTGVLYACQVGTGRVRPHSPWRRFDSRKIWPSGHIAVLAPQRSAPRSVFSKRYFNHCICAGLSMLSFVWTRARGQPSRADVSEAIVRAWCNSTRSEAGALKAEARYSTLRQQPRGRCGGLCPLSILGSSPCSTWRRVSVTVAAKETHNHTNMHGRVGTMKCMCICISASTRALRQVLDGCTAITSYGVHLLGTSHLSTMIYVDCGKIVRGSRNQTTATRFGPAMTA